MGAHLKLFHGAREHGIVQDEADQCLQQQCDSVASSLLHVHWRQHCPRQCSRTCVAASRALGLYLMMAFLPGAFALTGVGFASGSTSTGTYLPTCNMHRFVVCASVL